MEVAEVRIGQRWSAWVPGRRQWLLASVIHQKDGLLTLKFDAGYELARGDDEHLVEEHALTSETNFYRRVPSTNSPAET